MTASKTECDECTRKREEFDSDSAFELHMIHHDLEDIATRIRLNSQ